MYNVFIFEPEKEYLDAFCSYFDELNGEDSEATYQVSTASNFEQAEEIINVTNFDVGIISEEIKSTAGLYRADWHKVCRHFKVKFSKAVKILIRHHREFNGKKVPDEQFNYLRLKYQLDDLLFKEDAIDFDDFILNLQNLIINKKNEGQPTIEFSNGYALLIASNPEKRQIPSVNTDIQRVYDVLTQYAAYPQKNITVLGDCWEQKATKNSILSAFEKLSQQVINNSEATVFIYYSGHGSLGENGDYFLIPADYSDPTNGIGVKDLSDQLTKINYQKLSLWFDCCHAEGMMPKGMIPKGSTFRSFPLPDNLPDDLIKNLTGGSGKFVIASCKSDQISWCHRDGSGSIFTSCLLDALKTQADDDGYVRIMQVIRYLWKRVPEETGQSQNPIASMWSANADFVICYSIQS